MFNKNSYWLKSGIYTLLEKSLTLIFGFGTVFILYRKLSLEEVGIWAQFLTVTSLIELARNGLIQNGLIKFLSSADKETYPRILTSSIVLNLILTSISIIVLTCSANYLSYFLNAPILEQMFYYYIISTLLLIPFYHFQFIEQANFSFKGIFYSSLVRQGIFFAFIAIVFFANITIDLIDIVIFQIISIFTGSTISFILNKKFLIFERKIDFEWIKKLLNYGKFVFGTNISGVIFSTIGQVMLGNMKGNASAGLYNAAIRISNIVEVPTASVAAIIFPQSAKRMETTGRSALKDLYEKAVGLILALIIPISIVVLLFPKYIFLLVAGEKYLDAVPVLQLTIFFTLIAPFTRQFGTIIDSMGNPKLNFYFTMGSAVLSILLNYIFITNFGLLGAAYGTLTTYLAMFIFTQIVLNRMFKIRTINVFGHIFNYYKEGFLLGRSIIKKYVLKTNRISNP